MDAEGFKEGIPCPNCGSKQTITFYFAEGFTELECESCYFRSDWKDAARLQQDLGDLLTSDASINMPGNIKPLKA